MHCKQVASPSPLGTTVMVSMRFLQNHAPYAARALEAGQNLALVVANAAAADDGLWLNGCPVSVEAAVRQPCGRCRS